MLCLCSVGAGWLERVVPHGSPDLLEHLPLAIGSPTHLYRNFRRCGIICSHRAKNCYYEEIRLLQRLDSAKVDLNHFYKVSRYVLALYFIAVNHLIRVFDVNIQHPG